jgi:hypothetical protein
MAITKLRQRGITDQAVGSTQIENSSVAAADIAPATITTTQIAPGTIASSNIAPGTIAADRIAPGAITTTQIAPSVPLGVPAVSSDPPTPSLSEGDIFFRTDTKQLKCFAIGSAAFSAGDAIPYGASNWASNGTTKASTWGLAGYGSHPRTGGDNGARGKDFIKYDGSSWSNGPDYPYYNTGTMAIGTQSAALGGGGHGNPSGPNTPIHPSYSATTISYEFDGSSWGSSVSLNYAASSLNAQHGHGTQTDALITNGWTGPSGTNASQEYDGSSWSAGATAPTASAFVCSAGPSSDYLVFSGSYGSASAEFNGTSYSAGGSLSTGRPECSRLGTLPDGPTNTGVLAIGGDYPSPITNSTELYNGTSWSTSVPLANAPTYSSTDASHSGAGNTGAGASGGIVFGGGSPPYPGNLVAEYDGAALAILTSPATFS